MTAYHLLYKTEIKFKWNWVVKLKNKMKLNKKLFIQICAQIVWDGDEVGFTLIFASIISKEYK